ncbi:hypothetical protein ACE4ZV_26445, partial [Salmonella enterica]|uniref:hypothetical protein n=1 Tax=Salmonella enterica TaxID=28901 RepID=UPI003D2AF852
VNYTGLVPVLVSSIKELDSKIEQLKKDNQDLRSLINDICSNGCQGLKSSSILGDKLNALSQNIPNPFSDETVINYTFVSGNSAYININGL